MRRALLAAICLLIMSSAVGAAAYTIREAPGLQDSASLCDINNSGQGAGDFPGSDGRSNAMRWSASGAIEGLGQGYSLDINNRGQVLGQGSSASFVSNPDGTFLDLRTVLAGAVFPQRMNDLGWIAGYTFVSGSLYRGFVWSSEMGKVVLDILPGDAFAYATDVNNYGQVVGYSLDAAQTYARPFLWSRESGIRALPVLPGAVYVMPSRINDSGQVTGTAWSGSGDRAVLWNPDGTVADLGPGQAAGLNNRGQVAVSSSSGSRILNPDGSKTDLLPLPGATSAEIYGINDQGMAVGKSIWGNGVLVKATIWEPEQRVAVQIDLQPDTLNLKSKGNYVTCYIELPAGGYVPGDIEIASLRLQGDIAPVRADRGIGDYDADGIPDLMVKFGRQDLCAVLQPGSNVVTLSGRLADGTELAGEDTVTVIIGGK